MLEELGFFFGFVICIPSFSLRSKLMGITLFIQSGKKNSSLIKRTTSINKMKITEVDTADHALFVYLSPQAFLPLAMFYIYLFTFYRCILNHYTHRRAAAF